jgi:UDP-2,4-diacetamido-2,4,6-trideoxy-beta-L-altropyranose hydrolase
VDGSAQIGLGHLMRCLTLAQSMQSRGLAAHFISRSLPDDFASQLHALGIPMHELTDPVAALDPYAIDAERDSSETAGVIKRHGHQKCCLVVDHYGISASWEQRLRAHVTLIVVIDDMANRHHDCDLLIDQTHAGSTQRYEHLVPTHCERLCGSQFALLREEFGRYRNQAIEKRSRKLQPPCSVLLSLGGGDATAAIGRILSLLKQMPAGAITLRVLAAGGNAEQINSLAGSMTLPITVLTQVRNMAEQYLASDVAIGAAGTSSWERACLGLPTLMYVLADNQREIAKATDEAGAATIVNDATLLASLMALLNDPDLYQRQAAAALSICDGQGTGRVTDRILARLNA